MAGLVEICSRDLRTDQRRARQQLGFASAPESLLRRACLAVSCGLLGSPGLIVLDEACDGLHPATALVLKKHLSARVSTVIALSCWQRTIWISWSITRTVPR